MIHSDDKYRLDRDISIITGSIYTDNIEKLTTKTRTILENIYSVKEAKYIKMQVVELKSQKPRVKEDKRRTVETMIESRIKELD